MVATSSVAKPSLPTLDHLKATIPPNTDAKKIATEWFQSFSSKAEAADVDGVVSLFVDDCFWRDILSLTWDFRSFHGTHAIKQFLSDRLADANLKEFVLEQADLHHLGPDLAWIQALFKFQIGKVGEGEGVFRLVPTSTGEWKAHTVSTNLQALQGHPEKVGHHRDPIAIHGKWAEERRKEQEFEDTDPYVLIVGGGQSALGVAARLKYLDIPCLAVEKYPRIGHEWRTRYDALCLHEPVWLDHMPYIQ
jgi:ketosteroid isomerase-like protein